MGGADDTRRKLRGNLEQLMLGRRSAKPPTKASWQRETGRGLVHDFGEYRLAITMASGGQDKVVIKEDAAMIATRVWDCAVLVSKWLERVSLSATGSDIPDLAEGLQLRVSPSEERPIQILELGAGTGLLSICLAKMGAAVLSTEYGVAVRYLTENCRRNGVAPIDTNAKTMVPGIATCRELDWYKTTATLESLFTAGEDPRFDLIVVTDCSLTERDTRGVIEMIHKYGTPGHTKCVVGSCVEREGSPLLFKMVDADFKNVVEIETSDHHADYQSARHKIMCFDV